MSIRIAASKRIVERILRHLGPATIARRRMAGRTLILAWHNIVPPGASPGGDRSLHLSLTDFQAQLDVVESLADVVPLGAALEPGDAGRRPRVVLTFDDAYRGTLTAGVHELRSRGLPATVFVPPAYVPDQPFWWDDAAVQGGLSDSDRSRALQQWHGRDREVRQRLSLKPGPASTPECRCGTEAELRAATSDGLVTLGSHSWSHPNLATIPEDELQLELESSLRWLEQRFPDATIRWISYPYGLATQAVHVAADAAGYDGGLRVNGGWLPRLPGNRFDLPRLNVPAGLSADGLALRLSGLFT